MNNSAMPTAGGVGSKLSPDMTNKINNAAITSAGSVGSGIGSGMLGKINTAAAASAGSVGSGLGGGVLGKAGSVAGSQPFGNREWPFPPTWSCTRPDAGPAAGATLGLLRAGGGFESVQTHRVLRSS